MPDTRKTATEFVKANFRTMWSAHLSAFSRLLRCLRDEFDGDLDQVLILMTVAERTPPSNWVPELQAPHHPLLVVPHEVGQDVVNMQSIADYTGIPRETVRRKVKILEQKGWLTRQKDGALAVDRRAATDLERATGSTIDYIAAILDARDIAIATRGA